MLKAATKALDWCADNPGKACAWAFAAVLLGWSLCG